MLQLKKIIVNFMILRGDSLVIDRWRWLNKNLKKTKKNLKLLDVGCGNGTFSMLLARKGYNCLGLTWDKKDCLKATSMAESICLKNCSFEVQDVRFLEKRKEFREKFELAICTENIEHIIDDEKLIKDIASTLVAGGKLLLTTPNYFYKPIGKDDAGPFKKIEDGNHVRKGYTERRLKQLCKKAGLSCEEITYCGGFLSQKITKLQRFMGRINSKIAWCLVLPLKIFPPILDKTITKLLNYPQYSICLYANKPRHK